MDNEMNESKPGIGQPVRRKEDARLITGRGCFSDDVNLPDQAYAVMVRSPHAHARIGAIDPAAALAVPGVLAVLTGADCLADGLRPIPHSPFPNTPPDIRLRNRDGTESFIAPHFVLPADKARFVGEAVAMVVANSVHAAKDGAERVAIDYEVLAAVTDSTAAAMPDAPRIWEETASNVCMDADVGDSAATTAAFARAQHVVRLETRIARVTGVPMEPRAAVGCFDSSTARYTLYAGGGGVVRHKRDLTIVLGVPEDAVRVVARDVGGNFGTRNPLYPEFALVVWAARRIGRPVKWTCERQESFLSDYQGRDLAVTAELALDAQGNILGLRGSALSNLGAHTITFTPLTKSIETVPSIYRIPAAYFRARATLSNVSPLTAYRSSGRPEAMFVIERLIDLAAREHGFDRVELRRRNLVPESAMPYANGLGLIYDSGAYEQVMDAALKLGDWNGFAARRAEAHSRGRLRGIGIAGYVEMASGNPRERAEITVRPAGRVDVVIGTMASGQGHETSFAQLLVDWLGVPFDSVQLITGDTDIVPVGGGSHSGRSMRLAGITMGKASKSIVEQGRRIASCMLEAAETDIEFSAGRFTVKGTDHSVGIFEVAAAALERDDVPAELRKPLAAECDETVRIPAIPYGCHVCEVEVDPDTGLVEVARYAAVDDVGHAVNPLILHGQAHGSILQGLGQALSEHCHYDPGSGQLLSASFLDYALPRSTTMRSCATEISEVPSPTNPLGVRAGGEGGTAPAPAATANAVVDALAEFGVRHLELPMTPGRGWRIVNAARGAATE